MSSLENKKIKDTYKDLLQVSNENNGIDDTLRSVSDGEGTESSLKLSSTNASFSGNVGIGKDNAEATLHIRANDDSEDALAMWVVNKAHDNSILTAYENGDVQLGGFMYKDDTGNVGIGTSDPSASLHLKCTTQSDDGPSGQLEDKVGIHFSSYDSIANASIKHVREDKKDRLELSCGINGFDFAQMSLNNDGNVGIGTTSPDQKLEIFGGALKFGTSTAGLNEFEIFPTDEGSKGLGFYDRTNTAYRMIISNAGNVGIGTTNPNAKLHLNLGMASTNTASGLLIDATSGSVNSATLDVSVRHSTDGNQFASLDVYDSEQAIGAPKSLVFQPSGGNVGIGDTNPSKKLSVAGDAIITGDLTVSGTTITEDTQTLLVQNKNIIMGSVESGTPNDDTADGGGIILKGETDKSILYDKSLNAWNSSEDIYVQGKQLVNEDWVTENAFNNLTAAQHAQLKGDQGDPGTNGTDGKSAYEIYTETTSDAPPLTKADWLVSLQGPVGTDGKSAYEIYTEIASPALSEEDWLASLQGPVGTNGKSAYDIYTETTSDAPPLSEADWLVSLQGEKGDQGDAYFTQTENGISYSDGNVGIGTTSPSNKLSLPENSGITWVRTDNTDESSIINNEDDLIIKSSRGSGSIILDTNNVGIGTHEPETKLHIKGAQPVIRLQDTNTNLYSEIYADTGDGDLLLIADSSAGGTNPFMSFRIGGGALANEKMRILSNGNVGIGTNSPATSLDINKEVGEASPIITLSRGGVAKSRFAIANATSSILLGSITDDLCIRTEGGNIRFGTASATKTDMSILSNGNVGIGTNDPAFKLDVKGNITSGILTRIENDNTTDSKSTTLLVRNNSSATDSTILGLHNDSDYVLQVKNNGNVAIGQGLYDPTAKISTQVNSADGEYFLDVKGTTDRQWGFYYDQGGWESSTFRIDEFKADKTAHGRLIIANGGNVGIGDSNPSKKLSVAGDAVINGDLTVVGTTDSVNTTQLEVENKNIIMADSASPSDNLADGGGIIVKASTDKSILFNKTTNKFDVNIGATFSGLVGIGTTNPGSSLHVAGAIETHPLGNGVHMGVRATGGNRGIIQLNGESGGYIDFSVSGTDWKGRILYDNPDNYMRFDTNGQQRMHIDSDGNVGIGTTSPSNKLEVKLDTNKNIAFKGDMGEIGSVAGIVAYNDDGQLNSIGIRGEDIRFATANSEVMRIDSNGNVGIGTNNPGRLLDVENSDGHAFVSIVGKNDSRAAILLGDTDSDGQGRIDYDNSDDHLHFSTSQTEVMRLTSDGNVGIGTTSPGTKLTIQNTNSGVLSQYRVGSNYVGQITGDTAGIFGINGRTGIDLNISGDEASALKIDSNGNIGIGTTSPNARLEVFQDLDTSSGGSILKVTNTRLNTGTSSSVISLITDEVDGNTADERVQLAGSYDGNNGGKLDILTNNGTSLSTAMTIKADGNVGIGTASPANNLVIRGSSDTGSYLSDDPPFMVIENSFNEYSKNNIFGGIGFSKTGATNVNGSFSSGIRAGLVAFYDEDYNYSASQTGGNVGMGLNFRTSAQNAGDSLTRMTITGSGNVGIGTTTPSEFDSEANHLVIKGYNHTGMTICAGNNESRSNIYFADGSNGAENYAGGITYDHKDDNLSLRAGSQEAMWISSNGNVGIGTPNISSTYKLNVSGNTYVQGHVSSGGTILTSDNRIKHNEQPIKNALNTLSKIKPKKYFKTAEMYEANHDFALNAENKPIDTKGEEVECTIEAGVIAQELKKIDELAFTVSDEQKDKDGNVVGPHAVNYNSLFTYAISAINELNEKVSKLESELVISKFKLAELEYNQKK